LKIAFLLWIFSIGFVIYLFFFLIFLKKIYLMNFVRNWYLLFFPNMNRTAFVSIFICKFFFFFCLFVSRVGVFHWTAHFLPFSISTTSSSPLSYVLFKSSPGLTIREIRFLLPFGIFNGKEFLFNCSASSMLSRIRMLLRYGLQLFRINSLVNEQLLKPFRAVSSQNCKNGHCISR
jgi:hypothetical protein